VNVSLFAGSDAPEHVVLSLDVGGFDVIPAGEHRVVNLSVSMRSPPGRYNVTVTAVVGVPSFNETQYVFLDLVERGGSLRVSNVETLRFARDLFRQNPECLELSEFLERA